MSRRGGICSGPDRTGDGCGSGKLWKEPSNEEAISGGGHCCDCHWDVRPGAGGRHRRFERACRIGFSVAQIYENVPTAIGDTLAGYGKVDSINSIPVGNLCTGCELTYQFGGYTVAAI